MTRQLNINTFSKIIYINIVYKIKKRINILFCFLILYYIYVTL